MAETLAALGHEAAWVVHGMGLDELTVAGQSHVTALHVGKILSFVVEPEDAGLSRAPTAAIKGGDAGFNASALEAVLQAAPGAYRDTEVARTHPLAGALADLRRDGLVEDAGTRSGESVFVMCSATGHHHHLVCVECGSISTLEGCALTPVRDAAQMDDLSPD